MRPRLQGTLALIVLIVAAATVFGFGSEAAQTAKAASPSMSVLSPLPDAYVSGPATIEATAQPTASISSVAFFVDGRLVCTVQRPPFECAWDAGPTVVEHQIRVVATFTGGDRLVRNIRTKALDYAESVDVNVVEVATTVTDGRGHYVRSLPRTAFHVFEDGRPQKITSFASENVPLDLLVAVDISGSMTAAMPKLKTAVKEFLHAVPSNHEVTLLAFNDNIFTVAARAKQAEDRIKAIDRLAAWGGTSLYDVIIQGVGTLGRVGGRKAMIVFTDGEDQGSHAPIEDVERTLENSDVTLYMIGQGRGTSLEPLKKVMQRLVTPTGGRPLFTEKIDELRDAFTQLLDELSNQYLLGYAPSNTARDGAVRHIKVEVDGHNQVRARESYRAPAGANK